MAGNYEVWLSSPEGVRIANLSTLTNLQASRVVNQAGFFSLTMPLSFNPNLIQPDRIVQVWRQPLGGRLSLWRAYFIRKWSFATSDREIITIEGPDSNDLLRRRIVAAYPGSTVASKTDSADDMMKEIVKESEEDGVAPTPSAGTRVWDNLLIQTSVSAAVTITKDFAFGKLLNSSGNGVIGDIAQAARETGGEVFFDIVPVNVTASVIQFEFQTWVNQPGRDATNDVVFDQQNGNMKDPLLEYDYTEEVNYVYSGGRGEGSARNVQQVYDAVRYGASIWNRCEGFADARNQTSDDSVRQAGRAVLEEGRPRIRFSATPIDTQSTRFGRDWNFGDKVRARYKNLEFDTIVRAVTLSVDGSGKESIQARLDFEALIA